MHVCDLDADRLNRLSWQEACARPPRLELQPARLPPVVLPAGPASPVDPSPAKASASATLRLANAGGVTLALHLSLEPRSGNLLWPWLWLDPGSSYTAACAGNGSGACCRSASGSGGPTRQAGAGAPGGAERGGTANWAECSGRERALTEGGWAAAGGAGLELGSGSRDALTEGVELRAGAQPLRLAATLAPPAAVRASLIRRGECDGHFLVLSVRPQAPRHRGAPDQAPRRRVCLRNVLLLEMPTNGVSFEGTTRNCASGRY